MTDLSLCVNKHFTYEEGHALDGIFNNVTIIMRPLLWLVFLDYFDFSTIYPVMFVFVKKRLSI